MLMLLQKVPRKSSFSTNYRDIIFDYVAIQSTWVGMLFRANSSIEIGMSMPHSSMNFRCDHGQVKWCECQDGSQAI